MAQRDETYPFPMDAAPCARNWHCRSLVQLLSSPPAVVVKRRARNLQYVVEKIARFAMDEVALRRAMVPHVRTIMRGKKVSALDELLCEMGIRAPDIREGLINGFPITGTMPNSGLFDRKPDAEVPMCTKVELLKSSAWQVKRAIARSIPSDAETDSHLKAETADEVAKSWAAGPFTKGELDATFGVSGWLAARRFGIWQSSAGSTKFRLIDDYSVFGQNSTVGAVELLDHGGINEYVAVARSMLRALTTGTLSITDTEGVEHHCIVDHGWRGAKLLGRAIDLRSAYKQLAVAECDLNVAVTCMYDVDVGGPTLWINRALPFGSSGSVCGFNKCSRCLERVLSALGVTFCSSYVDDFPMIEPDITARSATIMIESLLSLLGWSFDDRGHKYVEYNRSVPLLSVEVVFEDDFIVVGNSGRWLSNIANECELIESAGVISPSDASRLAGRLNFVKSYVEGKPLNSLIHRLHEIASGCCNVYLEGSDVGMVLSVVREYSQWSSPRRIPYRFNCSSCILCSDGSLEGDFAGIGAVLFVGNEVEYIEMTVPVDVLESLRAAGSRHAISQVELAPVLVAKLTWADKLKSKDVLHYTDNNSVKDAIVAGNSSNLTNRAMLYTLARIEVQLQGRSWTARIPTLNNPADWPSRGETMKLGEFWACKRAIPEIEFDGRAIW